MKRATIEQSERFLRQAGQEELAEAVYRAKNQIAGLKLSLADCQQCYAAVRERLDKHEPPKPVEAPRSYRAPAESDG